MDAHETCTSIGFGIGIGIGIGIGTCIGIDLSRCYQVGDAMWVPIIVKYF